MICLLLITGVCIGSFLHACAFRYGNIELKHSKRSLCPYCHHQLAWYDLIPLFSYLLLKGKCRNCGHQIPLDVFLCELISAFCFPFIFYHFQNPLPVCLLTAAFIYASFCDHMYMIIPDRTHLLILISILMMNQLHVKTVLYASIVYAVMMMFSRITCALGMGDVKLISCCAWLFDLRKLLMMISIASITALIVIGPLFLIKKIDRRSEIPFGPFLCFSAFLLLITI